MNKQTVDTFYSLVRQIPVGKVSTYGDLAKAAGIHARQAGWLLHRNPDPSTIPCHRVVNSRGEVASNFAFGGSAGQTDLLTSEGVRVEQGKVDLGAYKM